MWRGWMNEYLLLAAHLFLLQGGHGVHLASSASRHGSCQVFMVYSSSFQRLIVGCLSLTGCWLALVLESYGLLWVPPGTWLFLQNVLPVLLSFSSRWVSSCAIISLKLIVHRGSFFGEHTIYFLGLLLCCLISSMVRLQLHHLSLHLEVVILTLLLQQIHRCDLRLGSVREAGETVIHLSPSTLGVMYL